MKLSSKYNVIATYELGYGFYVDIVNDKECYSAWLFHERYGIKELMFGMRCNLEEFLELVESDTDSIRIYIENREEEDGHEWSY